MDSLLGGIPNRGNFDPREYEPSSRTRVTSEARVGAGKCVFVGVGAREDTEIRVDRTNLLIRTLRGHARGRTGPAAAAAAAASAAAAAGGPAGTASRGGTQAKLSLVAKARAPAGRTADSLSEQVTAHTASSTTTTSSSTSSSSLSSSSSSSSSSLSSSSAAAALSSSSSAAPARKRTADPSGASERRSKAARVTEGLVCTPPTGDPALPVVAVGRISALTVAKLRQYLERFKLDKSGTKATLVERLTAHAHAANKKALRKRPL
jgi:hypothetical protein